MAMAIRAAMVNHMQAVSSKEKKLGVKGNRSRQTCSERVQGEEASPKSKQERQPRYLAHVVGGGGSVA